MAFTATEVPPEGDPESMDIAAEVHQEVLATESVEGVELYPHFDGDDEPMELIDPDAPLAMPAELAGMSWTDPRPEAPSRGEALAAIRETLVALLANPPRPDPDDPAAALIRVGDVTGAVKFRARGWVSGVIADIADGNIDPPIGITMTRADDQPAGPGLPNWYRLRRENDHGE